MPIPIDPSFALEMGKLLYEYINSIESVQSKLDRVAGMHLNAANEIMLHAHRVESLELKLDYVKRAREKFFDAVGAEREYSDRKFLAYYGLALCNRLLGDIANMEVNLKNAVDIYSRNLKLKSETTVYLTDNERFTLTKAIQGISPIFALYENAKYLKKVQTLKRLNKGIEVMDPFVRVVKRDYPSLI